MTVKTPPKKNTRPWHNPLPDWIREAPAYKTLRQGPCHTLQQIANRCDAPMNQTDGMLLVCVAGRSLIEQCRCCASTYREHIKIFEKRGWLVCLSYGGGRLANVYGVPGQPGQLDPFRAPLGQRTGTGSGGIWTRADTQRIQQLVSENRTLEDNDLLVSGNRQAAYRKSDSSPPKIGGQPSGNRTLPSPIPTHNHPITNKDVDVEKDLQSGSEKSVGHHPAHGDPRVREALIDCGVNEPALSRLSVDPSVTVPRIKYLNQQARDKTNPGGYLIRLLDSGVDWEKPKTATEFVEAFKSGHFTVVNGRDLTGMKFTRNDGTGVFVNGQCIFKPHEIIDAIYE